MLFNSLPFLVFFPVVTGLYFVLPHRFRWLLLLLASCVFYMYFRPIYILILFFTIIIDYFAGIWIENAPENKRRLYLIMSLVANIGVLAFFKYFNFLAENFNLLFSFLETPAKIPLLEILLPIGLSFHTFQAMSYTIEVYRGNQKAEKHFGIYALYVMYWPQLVAGPIERPQNVLHQFHRKFVFNYEGAVTGLQLMLWGFFKKVVIADRLAIYVNDVFGQPQNHTGLPLVIATIFFSFQIYCDFSGYSDIAIGASRMMGIDLMTNFRRPYFSKNISEFWSRWHISLSTWFRDYLYIPLGGNRVSTGRLYFNLFFVFLISGIWHGANYTFIIWGGLHGIYLIFALITKSGRDKINEAIGLKKLPKLSNALAVLTTFVLAAVAWVFFRAKNVGDAFYIISHFHVNLSQHISDVFSSVEARQKMLYIGNSAILFWAGVVSIFVLLTIENVMERATSLGLAIRRQPKYIRWSLYFSVTILIILFGEFNESAFIYFQF